LIQGLSFLSSGEHTDVYQQNVEESVALLIGKNTIFAEPIAKYYLDYKVVSCPDQLILALSAVSSSDSSKMLARRSLRKISSRLAGEVCINLLLKPEASDVHMIWKFLSATNFDSPILLERLVDGIENTELMELNDAPEKEMLDFLGKNVAKSERIRQFLQKTATEIEEAVKKGDSRPQLAIARILRGYLNNPQATPKSEDEVYVRDFGKISACDKLQIELEKQR
jgi:hypothetical protein